MPFLEDITYDAIYDTPTTISRIVYQADEQHPCIAIHLSTTEPFKFMRFFNNVTECQNYIRENVHKNFMVFISSINIIELRDICNHDQICEIHIFCMLPRHKSFVSRYLRQVHHKLQNVFMYDQLEYELLLFGVKYCKKVADEAEQENHSIADMALRDGQRLSQALIDYFRRRIEMSRDNLSEQSIT